MAIILVPQPGSTPTSLTDWTNAVESLKQYNLSVNQPLDYDFSGNTIKKGTQIIIGGANYYANADTAITGTASNYVKITSAGVASYVASLSGVTWNDTYNFYADGTGNAYIFNEGLAVYLGTVTTPKTKWGKNALDYYGKNMNLSGLLTVSSSGITSSSASVDILKPVNVTGNVLSVNGTNVASIALNPLSSAKKWRIEADVTGRMYFTDYEGTPAARMILTQAGALLVNTTTDDTENALQVTGSAKITGALTTYGDLRISYAGDPVRYYADLIHTESGVTAVGNTLAFNIASFPGGTVTPLILRGDNSAVFGGALNVASLAVTGATTLSSLTTNAVASFNSDVYMDKNIVPTLDGILSINGGVNINSSLAVTGATTLSSLTTNAVASFNSDVYMDKNIVPTLDGILSINGGANISSSLTVTGGVNTDNVTVKNRLYTGVTNVLAEAVVFSIGITPAKILSIRCYYFDGTAWVILTVGGGETNSISSVGVIYCKGSTSSIEKPYRMYVTYEA